MKEIFLFLKSIFSTHRYLWITIPFIAILVWFTGLIYSNISLFINLNELNATMITAERNQILFKLANINKYEQTSLFIFILPLIHLYFIKNLFQKDYHFSLPIPLISKFIGYLSLGIFIFLMNFMIIAILNYGLQNYLRHNYYNELMAAYDQAGYLYHKLNDYSIFNNGQMNIKNLKISSIFLLLLPAFYVMLLYFKKYSLLIFGIAFSLFIPIAPISLNNILIFLNFDKLNSYRISNDALNTNFMIINLLLTACLIYYSFYVFLKEKEA